MSLWFRRKDKQGRVHLYGIDISYLVVVAIFGVAFAFLLPLLQWLRSIF